MEHCLRFREIQPGRVVKCSIQSPGKKCIRGFQVLRKEATTRWLFRKTGTCPPTGFLKLKQARMLDPTKQVVIQPLSRSIPITGRAKGAAGVATTEFPFLLSLLRMLRTLKLLLILVTLAILWRMIILSFKAMVVMLSLQQNALLSKLMQLEKFNRKWLISPTWILMEFQHKLARTLLSDLSLILWEKKIFILLIPQRNMKRHLQKNHHIKNSNSSSSLI